MPVGCAGASSVTVTPSQLLVKCEVGCSCEEDLVPEEDANPVSPPIDVKSMSSSGRGGAREQLVIARRGTRNCVCVTAMAEAVIPDLDSVVVVDMLRRRAM